MFSVCGELTAGKRNRLTKSLEKRIVLQNALSRRVSGLSGGGGTAARAQSAAGRWFSLPNYVVDVQSIDVFKVRLDKFWAQQEVMFDWTADLTGIGDRSEYTVESY